MKKSFVICIKNEESEASLEAKKVYEQIPDQLSEQQGLIRVIDESGEDYLYPKEFFAPITVPDAAQTIFATPISWFPPKLVLPSS